MSDFSKQITLYQQLGTYNYSFDQFGNIILDPSSSVFGENYLSLPLKNFSYDSNKMASFYDPNFVEFIPTTASPFTSSVEFSGSATISSSVDVTDEVSRLTEENRSLTEQLNTLISRSEQDGSVATDESIRQVIVDLRIQIGEGTTSEDFEEEFPYGPK